MSEIISPEPVTDWRPRYLPPYLSNGLIGLRLGTHPLASGTTTVSGLEGIHPEDEIPTFAQAPYPIALDVAINGYSMAAVPQRSVMREQRYDFSCGEVNTYFTIAGEDDVNVEVNRLVFCSRTQPTLVLSESTVRTDRDCTLRLETLIDIRVMGHMLGRQTEASGLFGEQPIDGWMHWEVPGGSTSCGVAYTTEFAGTPEVTRFVDRGRACPLNTMYTFHAEPGREYRLRRIVSIVPSAMHHQPHLQAVRLVGAGRRYGFDQIRQDNRDEWARLWRGRIVLAGAPSRWQRMADAAYFYLHTSAHKASPSSTSIFGMAYWPNYHYYRGHIMWDVDTFALPPLMLTNPDIVRGLLHFRHSRLLAAQHNAAMAGYEGLQYPWEAAPDLGDESGPVSAASPTVEQHVSMDVALAFARFLHTTGDRDFAIDYAWPVVAGVAKWLTTRVELSERGYEIRRVNGPAETKTTVNNNAFVNMGAILALQEAAMLGRNLGRGMPGRWERIASRIVLPFDSQRGIILNHDGYRPDEDKGETPEALAGFCPLGYKPDPEVERRTIDYYLQFADKYAGAPMLSALLGVYGAWTGDRALALDLFERGYADFVIEPFTITTEFSPSVFPNQPVAGPFGANIGGFLIACLYGLPSIHPRSGSAASWCRGQVMLPQGWDAIHVEQVWARGEPMRLIAEHGARRARLPG